jgi:hypothetical protein
LAPHLFAKFQPLGRREASSRRRVFLDLGSRHVALGLDRISQTGAAGAASAGGVLRGMRRRAERGKQEWQTTEG